MELLVIAATAAGIWFMFNKLGESQRALDEAAKPHVIPDDYEPKMRRKFSQEFAVPLQQLRAECERIDRLVASGNSQAYERRLHLNAVLHLREIYETEPIPPARMTQEPPAPSINITVNGAAGGQAEEIAAALVRQLAPMLSQPVTEPRAAIGAPTRQAVALVPVNREGTMQFESKLLKLTSALLVAIIGIALLTGSPHHEQLVKLALAAVSGLVLAWVIK